METHELKTLPEYFDALWHNTKTFELRKNDRDFKKGDHLRLLEYENGKYTGREVNKIISHILKDAPSFGLKQGFVILSFQL